MAPLPAALSAIPSYPLLYPNYTLQITPLTRLTAHLSPATGPSLYMCHEHTNSPLGFGGNKIRKFEFLIPPILASVPRPTVLVTTGGVQSNRQRAVASICSKLGLKCAHVPSDDKILESQLDRKCYSEAGNVQLSRLLGAEIFPESTDKGTVMDELRKRGEVPYLLSSGSFSSELGGLGYAKWAFELDNWESKNGVLFTAIVVACSSGSTMAGMIAGFKYLSRRLMTNGSRYKREMKVIWGVDDGFGQPKNTAKDSVMQVAKRTGKLIGLSEEDITEDDINIDTRFGVEDYGRCDDQTLKTIQLVARLEGIVLDPVYTGKAAAGLIGLVNEGQFEPTDNILFVHTGGQTVLSAFPEIS